MLWPSRITAVQDVASGLTLVRIFSDPDTDFKGFTLSHAWAGGWSKKVVRGGNRQNWGKEWKGSGGEGIRVGKNTVNLGEIISGSTLSGLGTFD